MNAFKDENLKQVKCHKCQRIVKSLKFERNCCFHQILRKIVKTIVLTILTIYTGSAYWISVAIYHEYQSSVSIINL